MRNFLIDAGIKFSGDKIQLPKNCQSVRIDVGLSVNAPQSAAWLSRDRNLYVFGFEPVGRNRQSIMAGDSPWPLNLNPQDIDKRISIIPCALLENHIPAGLNMYVTKLDPGCSSILKPKTFEIDYIENVNVFSLNDFLQYFPFEMISFISHLKIDVQGADIQVLEGAKDYLAKIMCITVEVDTHEYEQTRNSLKSIEALLAPFGFIQLKKGLLQHFKQGWKGININAETDDPTFLNASLFNKEKPNRFWVYQRG
jgi:FkbM family methyltransferase